MQYTILVVEDDPSILELLKATLALKDYIMIETSKGEEALEIFKNGFMPDIVCMDMIMPGIDGSTTTKELKMLGSEAYFIAISALKNQSSSVVSLFDCWLPKPFTREHITGALAGYKPSYSKEVTYIDFKLGSEISKELKDELLHLSKNGAYSELKRVISELEDSPSKEFLSSALHKVNFDSIIKSIVSS